jgi:hypothetical protein
MASPEDRALPSQIKRRVELNGQTPGRAVALSDERSERLNTQTRVAIRAISGGLLIRSEPG